MREDDAFRLQLALRYYSYENELLDDPGYAIGTFPSDLHYQYSVLKPELGLRYGIKMRKITSFAAVGAFLSFFLTDEGYIYNERFDETINFVSGFERGHVQAIMGYSGELGLEAGLKPGNFSVSIFYENYMTNPFSGSYNMGIRCGYAFPL